MPPVRLAWFTPLPPMPSGIADYSMELVPYLAEGAEVTLVSPRPGRWRRARAPGGLPVLRPEEFARHGDGFDATFYHLGNNPYHEFAYVAARRRPGIAVFHDSVLHHLIAHVTIEWGNNPREYESILHREYGHLGTRLARLKRRGVATDFEKFLFPLTRHVAARARGIVVHSRDSAERMREAAPDVPLTVIPHHAGLPPAEVAGISREEARDRLGLPQDAFLVGQFGFVTRPKQPAAVLGGFAALHREVPEARLLVVGEDHTGGALGRLAERLALGESVQRIGYVDLVRFYLYMKAADAVVNLRYPSAGESSGTFARALAEGRATIVNNYASFAEVPPDVSLKVEIDRPQAEQLGAHLLALARDPAFRAGVEERARAYARAYLDPVRCRDLYLRFAEEVGGREVREPAPRARRARTATFAEARAAAERARPDLDRTVARTLSQEGNAAHVDALYRLLLRRPAEERAQWGAHAGLTAGDLTRARLVQELLESREFREVQVLDEVLKDLQRDPRVFTLREGDPAVGPDTTERVVEIPWMLSRWRGEPRVLDVGYAFASLTWLSGILDLPIPALHGVDMAAAPVPGMHRVRGDVRRLPYRAGSFDLIYCVSTIEHIGRDNVGYGLRPEPVDRDADLATLREFARVLDPFGRVLISVPFGRLEDHGWMLQYDAATWTRLIERSPFRMEKLEPYELKPEGWVRAEDPWAMGGLHYGEDAPAARGVLCAVLIKKG